MADMSKHLDKAYEGKEFHELVDAPVDALEGVSKATRSCWAKHLASRRSATWAKTSSSCARRPSPLSPKRKRSRLRRESPRAEPRRKASVVAQSAD